MLIVNKRPIQTVEFTVLLCKGRSALWVGWRSHHSNPACTTLEYFMQLFRVFDFHVVEMIWTKVKNKWAQTALWHSTGGWIDGVRTVRHEASIGKIISGLDKNTNFISHDKHRVTVLPTNPAVSLSEWQHYMTCIKTISHCIKTTDISVIITGTITIMDEQARVLIGPMLSFGNKRRQRRQRMWCPPCVHWRGRFGLPILQGEAEVMFTVGMGQY